MFSTAVQTLTQSSNVLIYDTNCNRQYSSPLFSFHEDFILQGDSIAFINGVRDSTTDYFWTGGIEADFIPKAIEMLGNSNSQLGVCLPGYLACNNTCSLDPYKPLQMIKPIGKIDCSHDCKTTHLTKECNGKCVGKYDPCNGICPENTIFCKKSTKCINLTIPCGDECLSPRYPKLLKEKTYRYSDYKCTTCLDKEWFCNDTINLCIDKRIPCNGNCPRGTMLCQENNECIEENEACNNRCLNPNLPIWSPWENGICLKEKDCNIDESRHMCNGICIPIIIPCNNECSDEVLSITYKITIPWFTYTFLTSSKLLGPMTCSSITFPLEYPIYDIKKSGDAIAKSINTDHFWTGSIDSKLLPSLTKTLGNLGSQLAVCLTGDFPCNGTCSIDPQKHLSVDYGQIYGYGEWINGLIGCTNDCDNLVTNGERVSKECNGKCIHSKDDPCDGICPENRVFCNETSKCIDIKTPCGDKCISPKYPKLKVDRSYYQKSRCISCDYDEWQCGMNCIGKHEKCNETCLPWYWKCPHNQSLSYHELSPHGDCLDYANICDGEVDCLDGSDEENCPEACEIPVAVTVACKGNKICSHDACEDQCFR